MTPDEMASARGHRLGKVNQTGRFMVRTCKRCGSRLVVSEENRAGFGGALERNCWDYDGDSAA